MKVGLLVVILGCCLSSGAVAQDGPIHGAMARAASAAVPERQSTTNLERRAAAVGSWSRVEQLDAGTKVTLTYADGSSEDRIFEASNDSKIMVRSAAGYDLSGDVIPRSQIREIVVERRRHAVGGAVIGAGAGFLMGLAAFGLRSPNECDQSCGSPAAAGAALAAVGAIVGYVASPVRVTREVVYRADR